MLNNNMKTEKLTTEELFCALPNFINIRGTLYHFGLCKGNNRVIVWYKTNESAGGEYLGVTSRSGKDLKDALKQMLDWLIEFEYFKEKDDNSLYFSNKRAKLKK